MTTLVSRCAAITGWGLALPDKIVTNADYEARLDTSDAWIVERTGIRERRHGGTTGGLAVEAGQAALDKAGIGGSDIDLLVLATTTPDQAVPATSATVHAKLGLTGAAFDLNAACAGYVYGVVTAVSMLGLGYTPRPRHRVRHPLAHHRPGGPRHGRALRRRRRRRRHRGPAGRPPLLLSHDLGLDGLARAHPVLRPRRLHLHGGSRGLPPGRARLSRLGPEGPRRRRRHAPTTSPCTCPTKPTSGSSTPPSNGSGSRSEKTAIVLDRTGNTSAGSIGSPWPKPPTRVG